MYVFLRWKRHRREEGRQEENLECWLPSLIRSNMQHSQQSLVYKVIHSLGIEIGQVEEDSVARKHTVYSKAALIYGDCVPQHPKTFDLFPETFPVELARK